MGHDTRSLNVALEDVGKTGEGVDTFLDARTARVVETDAGGTHLHGQILHFADFLGHGLGERTTVDGEILSIEIDQAAVDGGTAAHHAVAVELFLLHAEVVATVKFEHVEFFETSFVDEQGDALASGGFAFGVLLVDGHFAAPEAGFLAKFDELLDFLQLFTHID